MIVALEKVFYSNSVYILSSSKLPPKATSKNNSFGLCFVVLCCVALWCIALCCVVLCCVVLCCVVLCCVVLCCVVLCSIVLCCVVLCCVVLHVILSGVKIYIVVTENTTQMHKL